MTCLQGHQTHSLNPFCQHSVQHRVALFLPRDIIWPFFTAFFAPCTSCLAAVCLQVNLEQPVSTRFPSSFCSRKETLVISDACFCRPMPSCRLTNSVKALKGTRSTDPNEKNHPLASSFLDSPPDCCAVHGIVYIL